jgi:hypothetical protein
MSATVDFVDVMLRSGFHPVHSRKGHHFEGPNLFFECTKCHSDRLGMNFRQGNPRYGKFYCFACGYAGHAENLLPKEERPEYGPRKAEPERVIDWASVKEVYEWIFEHTRLTEEDHDYLLSRGADPIRMNARSVERSIYTIRHAFSDWQLKDAGVMRRSDGRITGVLTPGRLLLPYYDPDDGRVVLARAHDRNATGENKKWKYISPLELPISQFLYGTWNLPAEIPALLVTEGEYKTDAAQRAGFACVGLPGVQTAHDALAKFVEARGVKSLWICFDRELPKPQKDPNRKEGVELALDRLLDRYRFTDVDLYQVTLPLAPPGSSATRKNDIDSFVHASGKDAFTHVVYEAKLMDKRAGLD